MPVLIVTVDTEEEGLWSGQFRRHGNTVENVKHGVPWFQELCARHAIRPTYLVDAPVVEDDEAVYLLRKYREQGQCEIGAHVHPWCNPPFEEDPIPRNSFLCNLPPPLQWAKIEWLSDRIAEKFGAQPTAFRAGRYGIGAHGLVALESLGYRADSSVLPFVDYSAQGGPNFSQFPVVPFVPLETVVWADGSTAIASRSESLQMQPVIEIPVASGYTRWPFERWHRLRRMIVSLGGKALRLPGLLDRLNLARYVKFSPEQASLRRLKQLAGVYCRYHLPVMVMMLHSTSLVAGGSPYCRNEQDRMRMAETLNGIFRYCREDCGMPTATLSEYAENVAPKLRLGRRSARPADG